MRCCDIDHIQKGPAQALPPATLRGSFSPVVLVVHEEIQRGCDQESSNYKPPSCGVQREVNVGGRGYGLGFGYKECSTDVIVVIGQFHLLVREDGQPLRAECDI